MEGFNIKIDYYPKNNDIVIVKLTGYVDQSNSHQIEKIISDLLQSNKQKFIFDLSQLIYMSSAGWGIFVGEIKTVRDAGGDIKVSSMSPEVYDVFQVLEFYHILEDYPTVEAAIHSFDENGDGGGGSIMPVADDESSDESIEKEGGVPNLNTVIINDEQEDESEPSTVRPQIPDRLVEDTTTRLSRFDSAPNKTGIDIDIAQLPITEKIKKIVAVYPLLNIRQIHKMLRHEKFGSVNINIIKLYRTLRIMNLHSKKNRYRYYRSV